MTTNPMTFAVVPAAGHSTRMGRPKLSLTVGGRTVLEHVVLALRSGGVDRVVVVVGPHVPELVPLSHSAGADVCLLPAPTADMRSTVEHGLRWVEEHYHAQLQGPWLLAPADHPVINPDVVRRLLEQFRAQDHSIIIPAHNGRRGHPTLLSWAHVAGIRALPSTDGINTYLRAHRAQTLELPVHDPGILTDLDTPEDLERLQNALASRTGQG